MSKTVVVIGSDGYIGHPLCKRLEVVGHTVHRIDIGLWGQRLHPGTRKLGTVDEQSAAITEWRPDVVVDLASFAHDTQDRILPQQMLANNAWRALLLRDRHCETDWVVLSSLSVHSDTAGYPEAKRVLETIVWGGIPGRGEAPKENWRHRRQTALRHVSILRPGTVCGVDLEYSHPEQYRRHLLLNKMIFDAITRGEVHVSVPTLRRPVVILRYLLSCLVYQVEHCGPRGDVTNVYQTSGTLGEFARAVVSLCPGTRVVTSDVELKLNDSRDYGWGGLAREWVESFLPPLIEWTHTHKGVLVDRWDTYYKNVEALCSKPASLV